MHTPTVVAGYLLIAGLASYGASATGSDKLAERLQSPAAQALFTFRKEAPQVKEHIPGFLWLEAEDFASYGGWTIDTQYVAFMGSAYLIAAGVCTPVEPAQTTITVNRPGKYRLWARAMNWHPQHSPGTFKIAINGKTAEHRFGAAPRRVWLWESAGEFDLPAGKTSLALLDQSGAYGRCDALVLTTDLSYTPPEEAKALDRERARLTGVSLEPTDNGTYDVVVVGAGTAGCAAAIAAARKGAKTVLIQDRPVLGGNASIEMGVGSQGAAAHKRGMREGGIIEEAIRITDRNRYVMLSDAFLDLCQAETNMTLLLNQRVNNVDMTNPTTIAAVHMVNTLNNTRSRIHGKFFIDCTGDGWVGYYAGAAYRYGRESRAQTGEPLAEGGPDTITMSGCIFGPHGQFFHAQKREQPTPFNAPAWIAKIPGPEEFGRRIDSPNGGNWWLEHEGTVDDLFDPEFARDELIRIVFAYWDFLKNRRPDKDESACYELTHVPIWNARRETRRLMGDYVFNQMDAQTNALLPDRIAHGGWSLDVHHPKGIYSGKEGPYNHDAKTQVYGFPFRSLYSTNIVNLLFAGRNASVTHVALGTVRVESTLATFGQAVGTAAAFCLRYNTTPRGIYQNHIEELQQTLMRDDQYIPEMVNTDPADLARTAKVSASSTATYTLFGQADYTYDSNKRLQDRIHPLTTPRLALMPTGLDGTIDSVQLRVQSEATTPIEMTALLCETQNAEGLNDLRVCATCRVTLKPGINQWVVIPFKTKVTTPFFAVYLQPTKGVNWFMMKHAPIGSLRAYGGSTNRAWTTVNSQFYAMTTSPARKLSLDVRPELVIDGTARQIGQAMHGWQSDPQRPMPQWLQFDFATPTTVTTVHLYFDTDFSQAWPAMPLTGNCIKDYTLQARDAQNNWQTLAVVHDNFQRHCVHRIAPTTSRQFRVLVNATHGSPFARIFEVRLYNEK